MKRFALVMMSLAFPGAALSEELTLTGTYEGVVACQRTEEGRPGVFHKQWALRVLHEGDRLHVATWTAEDEASGKRKASLYTGKARVAEGRISGYVETCRPSVPVQETARILPSMEMDGTLSFTAETIFVTEDLPGREGRLIVESCDWVMDRISKEKPVMDTCETD